MHDTASNLAAAQRRIAALTGMSLLALAPVTFAQTESAAPEPASDGSSSQKLEEVVVSATKRIERIQDVPFAISAVNAETLVKRGELKLIDYSARVAGLQISDQSAASKQSSIVIRGLSGAGNGNPTAAMYLDEAPLNASTYFGNGIGVPDLDPGDLERIEVLKGPQGTLYGATSLGGLVKFVTRQPDFSAFSGRAELSTIGVGGGEWGYGIRGRINAPIAERAAVSISAFKRDDPGFIDDPTRGRENLNGADNYGGRAAVTIQASERVDVNLSVLHQRQQTDGASTVYLNLVTGERIGGDLKQNTIPGSGAGDAKSTIATGTVKADLDSFEITSATSYIRRDFTFANDLSDYFGALFSAPPPLGLGLTGAGGLYRSHTRNEKFTQELRLNSTSQTDFLGWQFGVFYADEDNRIDQLADIVSSATGASIPNTPLLSRIDLPSTYEEIAGFGSLSLRFSPVFDVEAGVRYSHNEQSSTQTVARFTTVTVADADSSEEKTTFSFNARYRPTRDLTVYGRIASGFRPGGPNVGQTGANATYDSDAVVSYEVGTKGALVDGTVTFDLAAFYVDWDDIQLQGNDPATGIQFFSNAGTARSKGIEAAFVLAPLPGLSIDANAAYTDAYLITPFTLVGTYAPAGSQLPYAPKWAWHLGVDQSFDLSSNWQLHAGAAYRYVGERESFFEATAATQRYTLDAYDTVDFTVGFASDRFDINLFLRNAFDERAYVGAGQAFRTIRAVAVNQPRSVGVSVTGKF